MHQFVLGLELSQHLFVLVVLPLEFYFDTLLVLFENHFKNIEKVLDWWEFDGSSLEGKNLMEYLEVSMNDIKNGTQVLLETILVIDKTDF